MIDLQVVSMRDAARVNGVDFVQVYRVREVETAWLSGAVVGGLPARTIIVGDSEVLVLPPSTATLARASTITLAYTNSEGTWYEPVLDASQTFGDAAGKNNISRVSLDNTVVRIDGDDLSSAVEVQVNGQTRPFTILSKSSVAATFPLSAGGIDSVNVFVTSNKVDRTTQFKYMLNDPYRRIGGQAKLAQQVLKALLTTPGSDVLDPDSPAGNMQNWLVGQVVSQDSMSVVAARVVIAIQRAGIALSISHQQQPRLPANERLANIEVVGVNRDPDRPTAVQIVLRIVSEARISSVLSLIMGTVDKLQTSLSGG